ncbi:MAG: hypothetical protein HC898_05850 [Phycisphaerales bacterium]|nr:hypothetical protein [Phycisphaerales bacterium]
MPGQITVHDEAGVDTDNKIDTIRLNGTTTASSLTITSSNPAKVVTIGRIIAEDDSTLGSLSFDGDLVGDGTDDVDLAIDGGSNSITLRNVATGVTGRVGGDLGTAKFNSISASAQITSVGVFAV